MGIPAPASLRYARAFYATAADKAVAATDLATVASFLSASDDLRRVLGHPETGVDRSKALLRKLFGARISGPSLRFLEFLAVKNRLSLLGDVAETCAALHRESQGIVRVAVSSAKEMKADQAAAVEKAVASRLGKKVEMSRTVDASLLGGFRVRWNDRLLDYSLKGKLDRLHSAMSHGA